jgi:PIN like domain
VTRPKPAVVRFYFDADVLGLAKVVASLRSDITYPGDPGALVHNRKREPCPIQPGALDTEWLPYVARQGWLVVTRDANIRENKAEVAAVIECRAKLVALASSEARNKWAQLELLMSQWRRIEELQDLPGPFIYEAYRTRLTKVAPAS